MPNVPASKGYAGGFGVGKFRLLIAHCSLLTPVLTFPIALIEKDLTLAMDAASAAKARLPLGGQAHQLYGLLNEHG